MSQSRYHNAKVLLISTVITTNYDEEMCNGMRLKKSINLFIIYVVLTRSSKYFTDL